MGMDFRGQIRKRVRKVTFFGLKWVRIWGTGGTRPPTILMSNPPPPPDHHSRRQQEALLAGLERVCDIFHENHDISPYFSRKYAGVTSSYRMLSFEINKRSRKSV